MKLKDLFEQKKLGKSQIEAILKEMGIANYKINSNLTVDINGDLGGDDYISTKSVLPFHFGRVTGDVNFAVFGNLRWLEGAPQHVDGYFDCSYMGLVSLVGAPSYVGGKFNTDFISGVVSLEGAPSYVRGNFSCIQTNIRSLHNIHKQIKYIGGSLLLPSAVESHVLGVMFIKGLKSIDFVLASAKLRTLKTIINKHLPGGNVHEAHEELIDAGLEGFAQL